MKHRVFHSLDLRSRLHQYAHRLGVDPAALDQAYQWLLEHDGVFEERRPEGVRTSISIIDIEGRIAQPLPRRLYAALRDELSATQFYPLFGLNWVTLKNRWWNAWEQCYNIFVNKIPFHAVRLAWLRLGGAKIGKGSTIWRNTEVIGIGGLRMGEDSVIAWQCMIDARSGLTIGDHVTIASRVMIVAGSHDLEASEFWSVSAPIAVEDYVWIASGALIGHGSRLGRGCVVTANTVVAKEIAPYKIVGGLGAKPMGERPHTLDYKVGGRGPFTLFH